MKLLLKKLHRIYVVYSTRIAIDFERAFIKLERA